MLPVIANEKVQCLESLVGIRTECGATEYPFYIEDIEGVDINELAQIAKASNPTGKDFGKQLINSASREMLGDIELLFNNGYAMKNIINDMCSNCSLLDTYVAGGGIIVKSNVYSRYQQLRITRLTIMTNYTGDAVIKFDDGVDITEQTVALIAGTLMPIKLNYSTYEKKVKIYFEDDEIGVATVLCSKDSGCGCGMASVNNSPVTFAGLLAGTEVSTQYGFLACAGVGCSYEVLICNLIKYTPNTFGLALLFKIGEKYYSHKKASGRNNEAVSFNGEPEVEQGRNYGRLYQAKMNGAVDKHGIRHIVNDYLSKNRNDKCIECDAKLSQGYATG